MLTAHFVPNLGPQGTCSCSSGSTFGSTSSQGHFSSGPKFLSLYPKKELEQFLEKGKVPILCLSFNSTLGYVSRNFSISSRLSTLLAYDYS
jgi:hypothetical protein